MDNKVEKKKEKKKEKKNINTKRRKTPHRVNFTVDLESVTFL